MAPQIIWLAGKHCGYNKFLKCLPNGRVMCMWRGTNCCMVHSSPNTLSSTHRESNGDDVFFFITGVRCGFRTGMFDFCPRYFRRRLETVLELTAVPFNCIVARILLQELFGEHITISLGIVFRETCHQHCAPLSRSNAI